MQTVIVRNLWAIGDTVCLSAFPRDLHRAYPGQYRLCMNGHYKNVFWRNNPYCEVHDKQEGLIFTPSYVDGIKEAGHGSKRHFLSWFHEAFRRKTGVVVPVTEPHGDIHLSAAEKAKTFFPYRYWLVVSGGKVDMTAKIWDIDRYQGVVDTLAHYGVQCVQAGGTFHKHYHQRLRNCESAVGLTQNERDMFSLVYHAEGVICGITSFMHLAAVWNKPCVVVAGGREEPWWEAYTNCFYPHSFGPKCAPVKVEHTFLHTVGLLKCQSSEDGKKGCWRDRTVPIEKADLHNARHKAKLCERPVRGGAHPVPECMTLIDSDMVVEAVMGYYKRGILPPPGASYGPRYPLHTM